MIQGNPISFISDSYNLAIAGVTIDTQITSCSGIRECHAQWVFGTVVGSYTTPTIQAKTSLDSTNWLTIGTAITPTVSTGTLNLWSIWQEVANAGTPAVVTSAASATVALGFGAFLKFTFAASGGYGTSAPVVCTLILK